MIRVPSYSRSNGFCHLHAGRLSNLVIPSLLIKRTFATQSPNSEKNQTALADREVEVQKLLIPEQESFKRLFDEIESKKLQKEIIAGLNKRGLTIESDVFIGPLPDGLDDLLGWEKIEEDRIKRNMLPERRKKIEEWAAKGDPLAKLRLENILDYEKRHL